MFLCDFRVGQRRGSNNVNYFRINCLVLINTHAGFYLCHHALKLVHSDKESSKIWYACTFTNGPQMGMLALEDRLHALQWNHSFVAPAAMLGQPSPGTHSCSVPLGAIQKRRELQLAGQAWPLADCRPGGDAPKDLGPFCYQRFCSKDPVYSEAFFYF